MRKRKLFLLALSCTAMFGVSFAWNVSTTNLTSQYTQCNSNETVTTNIYLTWQSYTIEHVRDNFSHTAKTTLTSPSNSRVDIRRNWIISSCSNWGRVSNVVEASSTNKKLVLLNYDGCVFNKPTSPKTSSTAIDAQIVYTIWYYEVWNSNNSTTYKSKYWFKNFEDYYWTCYPYHEQRTDISWCPDHRVTYDTTVKQHTWECMNYRVFWCGDWLVNGYNWSTDYYNWTWIIEVCDPNDPNETNWWNGWCSASCQPINTITPECNSQYNGQTQYTNSSTPWLNTGMNLCNVWNVRLFNSSWSVWSPRTFTWSCSILNGLFPPTFNSVNCSANQQWCGDWQLNGPEQCDPNDPNETNWWNGWCDTSCKQINVTPQCNSQYNGVTQYASGWSIWWLNAWMNLCITWSVTDFTGSWTPIHFTWNCTTWGISTGCDAYQKWCGDGVLDTQYWEECDPQDPNHTWWWSGTCDNSCHLILPPQCNSAYHWQTVSSLVSGDYLCTEWTISDFVYNSSTHQWTWKCNNVLWTVSCYANKPVTTGWELLIQKDLIWSGLIYNTWDIVSWRIRVTASWWNVTNFTIRDILPSVLWYSWYSVTHSGWVTVLNPTISTTLSWDVVKWSVIWTLASWNYVELKLDTYAITMPNNNDPHKNVACVIYEGEENCDDEPISSPKLRIKKTFIDWSKTQTVRIGDTVTYRIDFWNSWKASATITSIKDFLPKNVDYITGEIYINWTSMHLSVAWRSGLIYSGQVADGVDIEVYGGITLRPWDTWYIIIKAKVLATDQNNRTNFACIYLNDDRIECDDVTHEIWSLSCKPTLNPSSFSPVCPGDTTTFTTEVTCNSTWWVADLKIICDNNVVKTWHAEKLVWTCSANTNDVDHKVQCEVNGSLVGANWEACETTFRRNTRSCGWPSSSPTCKSLTITGSTSSDRVKTVVCKSSSKTNIKIDCGYKNQIFSGNNVKQLTWTCDYTWAPYGTYSVKCSAGTTCKEKITFTWQWWCTDCIYYAPGCFNVNTNNVSIEQWEVLPFFWNIRNVHQADWTILTGGFKADVTNIEKDIINANNTKNFDQNGVIALNSMICSFEIRNWHGDQVYKWRFPCLRSTDWRWEDWVSDISLLKAWMEYWKNYYGWDKNDFFWSFSNNDRMYALRSNINYIEDFWKGQERLWEYKLSLTNIEYLQCQNNHWAKGSPIIDSCENNFVLTNSYTVQKTPSGNLTASTDRLQKYLYMDGNNVRRYASNLLSAVATSEYAPNSQVSDAMTDFINKYQKLAITIKDGATTIKKVPGKNIYFVKWNINLGWNTSDIKFDKPVTFVQTEWNTTINWSVTDLNMMLLTNGSITFNWSSNCRTRQVVKWIFYAKSGINRTGVQKNNKLSNSRRCTEWWLTVKWVLIWAWLKDMMDNSRSNLNDWFGTTDSQKKNIVMNWASVLIEYSPSLFTTATMPPGAEDFTSALSIYKQ